MTKRLELMKYIIEKHKKSYHENFIDALLGIESISNTRLYMFEDEIIHSISNQQEISENTKKVFEKTNVRRWRNGFSHSYCFKYKKK